MPEWEHARSSGWAMASGELTGMGYNHAGGEQPKGVVHHRD
jgi:hypothetical protein